MWLVPLPVAIPLLVAALLAALQMVLPRRAVDIVACMTTAAVCGICCWLCYASMWGPMVYWFGNWSPGSAHYPLGISFVVDPVGAGLAALTALLMLAAMVFAWRYFESQRAMFHGLMMIFLAAMAGLCLTGDLFNLFVWFELMSASGVALCGYKSEEYGPLQGALNFAIVNTVGAFLSLIGVALLYAHTGSLNMAQVGVTLHENPPAGVLLRVALVLVMAGFLAKAAAFPLHFWLADAHAVAPTPVCVLFSGVMVELGVYAVVRLYYVLFADALGPGMGTVRVVFLLIGGLTALVGGIECFGQRHLKRLLAFSTISHVGVMFMAFGLLVPKALSGLMWYVVGHGLAKGTLFLAAGVLLNRFNSVDEYDLHGVGRRLRTTAPAFFLAAVGLAGFPPFGTFWGEHAIDEGAKSLGVEWIAQVVSVISFVVAVLTAGAVLRIGGRIYLGWGEKRPERGGSEGGPKVPMEKETQGQEYRTPVVMWLPVWGLLVVALVLGSAGAVRGWRLPLHTELLAEQMSDGGRYAAKVLERAELQSRPEPKLSEEPEKFPPVTRPIVTLMGACALALVALYSGRLGAFGRGLAQVTGEMIKPLRAIHSGRVGDYVAWLVLGVAVYGVMMVVGI